MNTQALITLLTESGAKIWEKGSMKRIYINDATAQTVFNENLLKDYPQQHIKVGKAKFWLDLNSNTLHADTGSIRTAINGTTFEHGLTCAK